MDYVDIIKVQIPSKVFEQFMNSFNSIPKKTKQTVFMGQTIIAPGTLVPMTSQSTSKHKYADTIHCFNIKVRRPEIEKARDIIELMVAQLSRHSAFNKSNINEMMRFMEKPPAKKQIKDKNLGRVLIQYLPDAIEANTFTTNLIIPIIINVRKIKIAVVYKNNYPKAKEKVLANKRLRPRKVRKSRLLKPFNKSFRACPSPKCKRKFFGTELKYERHLAIEHLKPKTVQHNGERDLSIEDDYICSNCCRTFGDIKAFGRHLIKSCKNYNCEPSFAVLEAMTNRVIPVPENSFKCLFCNHLSASNWSHEKHLKEVHNIHFARYKCATCRGREPRLFVHYQEYLKHWHLHRCSKENPWVCMDCEKRFVSFKDYRQHLRDPTFNDTRPSFKKENNRTTRYCSVHRQGKNLGVTVMERSGRSRRALISSVVEKSTSTFSVGIKDFVSWNIIFPFLRRLYCVTENFNWSS